MNAKRMMAAFAVLAMVFAVFAVVPADGPVADDEKYVELKGDFTSRLTFTEDQTVVVVGDLNIKDGGWLQISGDLTVKEGVTVTIEGDDGKSEPQSSRLYIIGNATIDGAVVSKTVNGLWAYPADGKEVVINGSVTAAGNATGSPIKSIQMGSKDGGTVTVNGTVTVGTNAQAEISGTSFSAGSELLVYGQQEGKINTAGHVLIDGTVVGESEILFTEASAAIDIVSIGGSIGIRDLDMLAYSYGGEQYYIAPDNGSKAAIDDEFRTIRYNGISIKDVTNVRITEKVTTEVLYNEKQSKNMMTASVKTVISAIDTDKAVENTAGSSESRVYVYDGTGVCIDSMTLSGVAVGIAKQDSTRTCLGPAEVTVTGDVVFSYVPASSARFVVDGVLDVTGSLVLEVNDIQIQEQLALVNAAFYKVKDADNRTYFHYTVLKQAIQSGATDIKLLGQIVIDEDITVPAPVKLTVEDSSVPSPIIKEDATLTIADGAGFVKESGLFSISGTLTIENIDYGITIKEANMMVDVKLKSGQKVVYTNIHKAMADAKAGDEIDLFKPAGNILTVEKDLTVPAGVTLDTKGLAVLVNNGCVLTAEGKIILDAKNKLMSQKDTNPQDYNDWNDATPASDGGEMKEYSVLRIAGNGSIVFKDGAAFADLYKFKIFGAYYNEDDNGTKGSTVITSPAVAFPIILDAYNNSVSVYGEVALDNLTVSGNEKERMTVVFTVGSKVTMKNFTFFYGTVTVMSNPQSPPVISGDIGTASGRMVFDEASVIVPSMFSEEFVGDAMNLTVTGVFESENETSIGGTVYANGVFTYIGKYNENRSNGEQMRLSVPAGAHLFIDQSSGRGAMINSSQLYVEGTVTVTNSGSLKAHTISALGTLNVLKADGRSGTLNVGRLCIGAELSSFDHFAYVSNGTASVTGDGTFVIENKGVLTLFNGASITATSLLDWIDDADKTECYIDGALWMTVFVKDHENTGWSIAFDRTLYYPQSEYESISNFTPVLDNAEFVAWQTYDEKTKAYETIYAPVNGFIAIGTPGYEKVYADIDRLLYDVTIIADMGIDDIFIDGKIILKDKTSNTFTEKVAAGTHTITYTLANGYSGNASIVAIDGKTISGSGLTFVIDDDKAGTDMKMEITVSGIEKSGYDTDPETHDEKASGLTTTEILLIVVVVIIAIMAVVLILRLNRS